MVILSSEVLYILSFFSLECTLSIFLATQHPRSVWSPWQQCNTFGALSGYLIKTGFLCVRWTWTFLLSLKLLSEVDTPPEKCEGWGRGQDVSWEREMEKVKARLRGSLVERCYSAAVWSPWWCLLYWSGCTMVTHSKSIHRWPLLLIRFWK